MAFQFWKESLTRAYGGIVVTVLSQLRTFTVLSVTSVTMPSASYLGILIQSPTFSISLADNCMPLTKPIILSLNTSINTAADAPSPARSDTGSLSITSLKMTMPPTNHITTWSVCNILFSGRLRKLSLSL